MTPLQMGTVYACLFFLFVGFLELLGRAYYWVRNKPRPKVSDGFPSFVLGGVIMLTVVGVASVL